MPERARQFVVETIRRTTAGTCLKSSRERDRSSCEGTRRCRRPSPLNWYLKYCGHCHVSLNGRQLDLPPRLPVVKEKVRQVGWARSRYFLNYCTFGYSMPWWDWTQWERFIDWMALNGINQPLAVTGQEAVWQAVGAAFGMTDAEIEAFLPGPPYLPFGWMGCLDGSRRAVAQGLDPAACGVAAEDSRPRARTWA